MKVVKKNSNRLNYYKEYNQVLFWSILELFDKVGFLNLNIDLMNASIFYATNRERTKRSLPPCDFHPKLAEISMLHSLQMKKYNFFDHENQYEKGYRTLKDRLEAVYSNNFKGFRSAAENIFETQYSSTSKYPKTILSQSMSYLDISKQIVEGWMNSEGHRLNILNPKYKYMGCSCVPYELEDSNSRYEGLKVTQNFGGELVVFQELVEKSKVKISKKLK